jgi:hypothetical protein
VTKPALALLAIIAATIVVPGAIAYRDDVFFERSMAARLESTGVRALHHASDGANAPVMNAFIVNRLNLLWWPLFALLAALLLCSAPSADERIDDEDANAHGRSAPHGAGHGRGATAKHIARTAVVMFVVFDIPNWARNFILGDENRRIYSFVNWDISKPSYLYQELEVLAILTSVAWTIARWNRYHRAVLAAYPPATRFTQASLLPRLSREVARWQLASLATAGLFGAWLAFYMGNILVWHDQRYIPSAFILEVFGVATWWYVTRPLLHMRRLWIDARNAGLQEAAADLATADARLKVIAALEPANVWSAVLSSAVVLITFLLPMIRAAIGK